MEHGLKDIAFYVQKHITPLNFTKMSYLNGQHLCNLFATVP